MGYKPDYGLRLMAEGFSQDVDISFHHFRMFSLSVLNDGRFSTTIEISRDGEWLALSLDFDQQQLDQILSKAPRRIANVVRKELARDATSPRPIDFPGAIDFGVRARLGQVQHVKGEDFVPLIAQEIVSVDSRSPVVTSSQPHVLGGSVPQVIDPLIVIVSRADVEHLRTRETLVTLQRWIEMSRDPHEVRGRLRLAFHGYDDDLRELWEVSDVREFVNHLDQEFPYWFYLADLQSDFLMVVAFCLCQVFSPHPGSTIMNPQDFAAFLERHFSAMNQLLDQWSVPESENEKVSNEISAYFDRGAQSRSPSDSDTR